MNDLSHPHPCPLIVLFHTDADVETTLSKLFESQSWVNIDLRTMNRDPLKKELRNMTNVCIRHPGHLHQTGKHALWFLNLLYMNSRCLRLRVVVLFKEFVPHSLTPLGLANTDWIIVKKRGPRNCHGWDTGLFEAASIPLDQVDASTCDLVGVAQDSSAPPMYLKFIEVRFEDELASRERIRRRCDAICEELMRVTWHPDSVRRRAAHSLLFNEDRHCFVDAM